MACLNMHEGGSLGPRISFSNDFAEAKHHENTRTTYTEAPVSSDFEFSVPSFSANAADELFFKAKIPPLKEKVQVTLRDELLAGDDDDDDIFLPKSSGWWKFGRSQTLQHNRPFVTHGGCLAPKKRDHNKNLGGLETIDEANQHARK